MGVKAVSDHILLLTLTPLNKRRFGLLSAYQAGRAFPDQRSCARTPVRRCCVVSRVWHIGSLALGAGERTTKSQLAAKKATQGAGGSGGGEEGPPWIHVAAKHRTVAMCSCVTLS
jgi:hypothetical protein